MLSDFLKEDGIKVVGEHTIRFTLTQPYAPFLSFVPWWYVMNPKQVLAHEQNGDLRGAEEIYRRTISWAPRFKAARLALTAVQQKREKEALGQE